MKEPTKRETLHHCPVHTYVRPVLQQADDGSWWVACLESSEGAYVEDCWSSALYPTVKEAVKAWNAAFPA